MSVGPSTSGFGFVLCKAFFQSLPTNELTSILAVAIVPPHLAPTHLPMRMAVSIYVRGIFTSYPPRISTSSLGR